MALIRLVAAASLLVIPQLGLAADKVSRPDPRGVAPSAFYIGLHGGAGWGDDKITQYNGKSVLFEHKVGSDPAFGGLHVGFRRQLDGVWLGIEADYDMGGAKGSTSYRYSDAAGQTASLVRSFDMDFRSTLRARIGYEFGAFAIYGTGGGAMTNVKMTAAAPTSNVPTAIPVQSNKAFGFGATLGAGVEYKLSRNWAAFSEYRYADFGKVSGVSDNGILGSRSEAAHRITETTIRAGATYYFR